MSRKINLQRSAGRCHGMGRRQPISLRIGRRIVDVFIKSAATLVPGVFFFLIQHVRRSVIQVRPRRSCRTLGLHGLRGIAFGQEITSLAGESIHPVSGTSVAVGSRPGKQSAAEEQKPAVVTIKGHFLQVIEVRVGIYHLILHVSAIAVELYPRRIGKAHTLQVGCRKPIDAVVRNAYFHPTALRQHGMFGITLRSGLRRRSSRPSQGCRRTTDYVHLETRQLVVLASTAHDRNERHVEHAFLAGDAHLAIHLGGFGQRFAPCSHTPCLLCGQANVFGIVQTDFIAELPIVFVQRNDLAVLRRNRIQLQNVPIHVCKFLRERRNRACPKQEYGRL